MTVVSNEAVKAAAEEASKAMTKPEPVEEPVEVPSLSEHVPHAELRYGRAQIEVRGYELAIAALEMELRGAEQKASGDIAKIDADAIEEASEIDARAKRRIARIKEDFIADQSNIMRRLEDLRETRDMMQAMIDVHAQRHPKPEERANAETDTQPDPAGTGEDGSGAGQSGQ
jgi:hypothetical protein